MSPVLKADFEYVVALLARDALEVVVNLELAASLAVGALRNPVVPFNHGTAPEAVKFYIFVIGCFHLYIEYNLFTRSEKSIFWFTFDPTSFDALSKWVRAMRGNFFGSFAAASL